MKELFLLNDTQANKISYFHLLLLMASLPFDRFYSHLILISLAVNTLIYYQKGRLSHIFNFKTLVLQSAFFVAVIGTGYSSNTQAAFTEWGLKIPILLFPILFAVNPINLEKYRPKLLSVFALVCTAVTLYLYADAFIDINYYHLPFSTIFTPAFNNHNFSLPIGMHATFLSIILIVAFVHLLVELIKTLPSVKRLVYGICCLILLFGIFQLSSKSALAALFVTVNIVVPFYIPKGKVRLRFILVAGCLSAVALFGLIYTGASRQRLVTGLKTDLLPARPGEQFDSRVARWHVAAGLIKQRPFIGYGAGSEIPLLNQEFFKAKLYSSYLNQLNAHSQYLSFLLKSGAWGLAVYLLTLGYGFKQAVRKRDVAFICFMLLIAITSLSEDVLEVDKGVMFYSFFFSFFAAEHPKPPAEPSQPDIAVTGANYLEVMATNMEAVPS